VAPFAKNKIVESFFHMNMNAARALTALALVFTKKNLKSHQAKDL
jgi:hypothetical protein